MLIYEARTHQVDGVSACPIQVGYWRALDTSTTRVQHAVLCILFKKYYFLVQTRVEHNRIWLEHASTQLKYGLDMAWIRLEYNLILFFPIIWWIKKEFKGPKTQVHLGILFEVSTEIVSHSFWKGYRKYTWYILRMLYFFLERFRK